MPPPSRPKVTSSPLTPRQALKLHAIFSQTQHAQQQFESLRNQYVETFQDILESAMPGVPVDQVDVDFLKRTLTLKEKTVAPPTPTPSTNGHASAKKRR